MATKFSTICVEDHNKLAFLQSKVWEPARTGDYAADCDHGRSIGMELVDLIQATNNPLLISTTAQQIMAAGTWGGVEVGFFTVLGCQLR